MGYNRKKGFTFIELIVTFAVIIIIAVVGAYVMMHLVQNSIYIPNQLNMDMLASDALDLMIEGDPQAKGLRFSREITVSNRYLVTFINQDSQEVTYRLRAAPNRLFRSIDGSPEEAFPYYVPAGITLTGKNNRLFTYYDATGSTTNDPTLVKGIMMRLVASTGSGSVEDWEGKSEQSTAIIVDRYQ